MFRRWSTWILSGLWASLVLAGLVSSWGADRVSELRFPEEVATRTALRPLEAMIGLEDATAASVSAEAERRDEPDGEPAEEDPADGADEPGDAGDPEPQPEEEDPAQELAEGRANLARAAAQQLALAADDIEASAEELRAELAAAADDDTEDAEPDDEATPDELRTAALRVRVRGAALLGQLGESDWREPLGERADEGGLLLDALEAAFAGGAFATEQAEAARRLGEDVGALALRQALGEASGDIDGAFALQQLGQRRAQRRFESLNALAWRLGPFLFAGLGLLAASFFLPRDSARVGHLPSPSGTFRPDDGWAVFVRYFILFQLIGATLGLSLGMQLGGYEVLIASLPVVGFAHLVAVRRGRMLADLLGIDVDTQRPLRFVPVTLAAWVLCLGVLLGLAPLLAGAGSTPWANPIVDALADPDLNRAGLLRGGVLWAPLFEELAFRGVLYAALRARLGVLPAVLLSSLAFGFAHSYDLSGNLVITAVGIALALTYERSQSLLPCIFAHALFNYGQIAYALRMYG